MPEPELITLNGDEDGGVGIGCSAHWDEGRPLGYHGWSGAYKSDPMVVQCATVSDLLDVGRRHLAEHHAESTARL